MRAHIKPKKESSIAQIKENPVMQHAQGLLI